MLLKNFKLYLTLFSLIFILSGCYTLLSDPFKIKNISQVDIHNIEEQDKVDELHPMVNKYYVRRTHHPYVFGDVRSYVSDPYYYNRYNSYGNYHIHDVPQAVAPQASPQQIIKVEVKSAPTSRDVEKARMVWELRTNPSRIRKVPTPTRREKDGD